MCVISAVMCTVDKRNLHELLSKLEEISIYGDNSEQQKWVIK